MKIQLKIGEHCLVRIPGISDQVGIFRGRDEKVKTHVNVDVRFKVDFDSRKFSKEKEPYNAFTRREWVMPYPVIDK